MASYKERAEEFVTRYRALCEELQVGMSTSEWASLENLQDAYGRRKHNEFLDEIASVLEEVRKHGYYA